MGLIPGLSNFVRFFSLDRGIHFPSAPHVSNSPPVIMYGSITRTVLEIITYHVVSYYAVSSISLLPSSSWAQILSSAPILKHPYHKFFPARDKGTKKYKTASKIVLSHVVILLTDWLTYLHTDLLNYLLIDLLNYLLTYLLIYWLTYLLNYLITDLLNDLLTYLITYLLSDWFTKLLTDLLISWLT
jgi:hypothetical protein